MKKANGFGRIGLVIATGSALLASVAIAQTAPAPAPTPCPMGPGMMGMMGPGMMGPMMGSGMMGGYAQPQANLNLSVDDVRGSVERWIAMTGNPRLKPGKVAAANADTITAEVVTVDKEALVQRYAVNRHTGYWQQVP
ncbi:hypothetical protein ACFFF7_08815 [Novosphingobium aquiterrae]|uniref:Uncharacterized protein n=1 Tax=Novosphingobium aquiterrae TaxID=624388 RepID=A0ABV6PI59_9SPHN